MVIQEFVLTVNYNQTVRQAIVAGGYNWTDINIKDKNFPFIAKDLGEQGGGMVKLFRFDDDISSEDVILAMTKANCRPANLMELLSFGATYPKLQEKFPIIALSPVQRRRTLGFFAKIMKKIEGKYFPWLVGGCDGRGLDLIKDRLWHNRCHFLAVPK